MSSIAVVLIATGREEYFQFIPPLIASLKKFFPPHDVVLFTDSDKPFDAIKFYHRSPDPRPLLTRWHQPSLRRYHTILEQEELLSRYDYIFHLDVDMLVVEKIKLEDICSDGITAVLHPDFPDGRPGSSQDAFDRNPKSTACVKGNPPYYHGPFQGGSSKAFLEMCRVIAHNIDIDDSNNVESHVADESHLNHYLAEHPPTKILSPAFAWPDDSYWKYSKRWTNIAFKDFVPVIRHFQKMDTSWKQDNKIIQSVWFGPKLTPIQILCLKSYMDNGHEFHLYVSEPVENIPPGVIVYDLASLFPDKPLEKIRQSFCCYTHFSDYARAVLILKKGGWYVDLDTVCLKHLDFPEPYVFISESIMHGSAKPGDQPTRASEEVQEYLSGCTFKAPPNDPFLQYIVKKIESMDRLEPTWCSQWVLSGPGLFKEAVPKFGLQKYVKPPCVLDAMKYTEYPIFVNGGAKWDFSEKSYVIHLRTSCWKCGGNGLDPNRVYDEDSLFEQLKRKHGVGNDSEVQALRTLAEYGAPTQAKLGRVSIIISLYNKQNFIVQAIESAITQDYKDFEVIIVNDGSTDKSHDIAKLYSDRVTLIDQKNAGVSAARNRGISVSTGEFFLPLDADDWLEKNYLSKTVPKMWDRTVGAVVTDVQLEGRSHDCLSVPNDVTIEQEVIENKLPGHALYRLATFLQIPGGYNSEEYEDWNLWIDILKRDWKIATVHEPLVHYRTGVPNSACQKGASRHEEIHSKLKRLHPDLSDLWKCAEDKATQTKAPQAKALQVKAQVRENEVRRARVVRPITAAEEHAAVVAAIAARHATAQATWLMHAQPTDLVWVQLLDKQLVQKNGEFAWIQKRYADAWQAVGKAKILGEKP